MNYKYQSFDDAKLMEIKGNNQLTEEISTVYLSAVSNPDLSEFLNHQREEFLKALESGKTDERWNSLWDCTLRAEQSLESGNLSEIASAFFGLGEVVERLNHPDSPEMITLYTAMLEKMDRQRPLNERNRNIAFLKDCSEVIAQRIWRNDTAEEIRLSEACQMVWTEIVDVAGEYKVTDALPDKADSLKDWLRPIAPEYARKAGRPKKGKN